MNGQAPSSTSPYDLSEDALKELYLENDEDHVIAKLLAETEEPRAASPQERPAADGDAEFRVEPISGPTRAAPAESTIRLSKKVKKKPASKIAGVVLVALAGLAVFGWASYRPAQTPTVSADAAKGSPAIVGALRVADLAAGHKINPGETYDVDLPAGKVRVAVVAGEVRLLSKGGASLRPCSNQPFVVDASSGSDNSAHPLVSACGHEASFVQAEIPPPPLPSPAPVAAITPSTIRAGD